MGKKDANSMSLLLYRTLTQKVKKYPILKEMNLYKDDAQNVI